MTVINNNDLIFSFSQMSFLFFHFLDDNEMGDDQNGQSDDDGDDDDKGKRLSIDDENHC